MRIVNCLALFIGGEIANLIEQSGPVAKVVLLVLLIFSLFSWAVILAKWASQGRARVQSGRFIRAFRKEVGLSPHAYLNQLRLLEARRLIAQGRAPADVATQVGFYDQSHLIRHFKRVYGITPGQYAAAVT